VTESSGTRVDEIGRRRRSALPKTSHPKTSHPPRGSRGSTRINGLKFAVDLTVGGPGETKETVMESVANLPKLHFTMVMYGIGIRILPQTALADIAV
jgi:hypothetical protein